MGHRCGCRLRRVPRRPDTVECDRKLRDFVRTSGDGKDSLRQILANQLGVPLIATSIADLFATIAGFLDSVIKATNEIFSRAEAAAPCVFFLDELDALPGRHDLDARSASWWTPVIANLRLLLDLAVAGILHRVTTSQSCFASTSPCEWSSKHTFENCTTARSMRSSEPGQRCWRSPTRSWNVDSCRDKKRGGCSTSQGKMLHNEYRRASMLIITVDLLPGGQPILRKTLGTTTIANKSDLSDLSNYRVEASEAANDLAGTSPWLACAKITDHARRQSVWRLVAVARHRSAFRQFRTEQYNFNRSSMQHWTTELASTSIIHRPSDSWTGTDRLPVAPRGSAFMHFHRPCFSRYRRLDFLPRPARKS